MKKKLLLSILISMIGILLCSCQIQQYEETDNGKLTIATTIFPYYDFARAIGGDLINLELIIPAGRDSHSFEPTPADMITIEQADLFLYKQLLRIDNFLNIQTVSPYCNMHQQSQDQLLPRF